MSVKLPGRLCLYWDRPSFCLCRADCLTGPLALQDEWPARMRLTAGVESFGRLVRRQAVD